MDEFTESVMYEAQALYARKGYISLGGTVVPALVARALQEGSAPGAGGLSMLDSVEYGLKVIGEGDLAAAVRALSDSYRRAVETRVAAHQESAA